MAVMVYSTNICLSPWVFYHAHKHTIQYIYVYICIHSITFIHRKSLTWNKKEEDCKTNGKLASVYCDHELTFCLLQRTSVYLDDTFSEVNKKQHIKYGTARRKLDARAKNTCTCWHG